MNNPEHISPEGSEYSAKHLAKRRHAQKVQRTGKRVKRAGAVLGVAGAAAFGMLAGERGESQEAAAANNPQIEKAKQTIAENQRANELHDAVEAGEVADPMGSASAPESVPLEEDVTVEFQSAEPTESSEPSGGIAPAEDEGSVDPDTGGVEPQ